MSRSTAFDGTGGNASYKRGIVKENRPGKSRVEFADEDGTVSYWLTWTNGAAGASKMFNAPDVGSQVNCLIDEYGEDGTILGASYSEVDTPPTQNLKHAKMVMEGGLDVEYDKATGVLTIVSPTSIVFKVGGFVLTIGPGGLDADNGYIKNDGHRTDKDHVHDNSTPGPGTTGKPL